MAQKLISNLKRDKLLNQCENLMLRGVDSPTDISDSLNISYNTAKSYISLVKERWSSSTTVDKLQAKRQELIRKTEEIIKEAWLLKSNARNTLEAVSTLRTMLMCIERLEKLQGINSLPLPLEKPKEIQMYELAQKVNALPKDKREKILLRVKEEIRRRKTQDLNPIPVSI